MPDIGNGREPESELVSNAPLTFSEHPGQRAGIAWTSVAGCPPQERVDIPVEPPDRGTGSATRRDGRSPSLHTPLLARERSHFSHLAESLNRCPCQPMTKCSLNRCPPLASLHQQQFGTTCLHNNEDEFAATSPNNSDNSSS